LKNRMELPNGSLVPLTSPKRHVPMSVAAVYAEWPWDDLASALVPNGNLSSTTLTPPTRDLHPVGVGKESWINLLYAAGAANYLAPVGADPQSDLTKWHRQFLAGEPTAKSEARGLAIMQTHKSAIGIPLPPGGPAPTAIQSGWTDSLFPVSEAMHYANRVSASGLHTPLLLMFADIGHGWAQSKGADVSLTVAKAISFLDQVVLHHQSPPTGVLALPMTCPASAPSVPVRSGTTLASLAKTSVSWGGPGSQPVTSSGGSPATATDLNPAYAGKPLCNPLPSAKEPGTATYFKQVGSAPVTLLGAPSVTAKIDVTGPYPELVARLWDVNGSTRQIVAMGVLRPSVNQAAGTAPDATASQSVSFQLNPNDYTFAAGHRMELELVGSNAPYFRKSNGTFTIKVSHLKVSLPTT
jgi:hypothetical protein